MSSIKEYRLTTLTCFIGIFVQAIITNIVAILFLPMARLYNLGYADLGILVGVNFAAQVTADISFSGVIDKIGYKKLVIPSTICAFIGLVILAFAPNIFKDNVFIGLLIGTIIMAFASGLFEILTSPIISAIHGNDNGPAMGLLHSFYAWGQVLTVIVTTCFIFFFGDASWQIIMLVWALVPFVLWLMVLKAKFPDVISDDDRTNKKELLLTPFFIFALLAIFSGGATEVIINQWSSTFMEKGLELPKIVGDIVGMCGFAALLGVGRSLYGFFGKNISIHTVNIYGSLLAIICYLVMALSPNIAISVVACVLSGFAVSMLWPGTIVISSVRFPMAGGWMFAILACFGDIGAGSGPFITGISVDRFINSSICVSFSNFLNISSEQGALRLGILVAVIFPCISLLTNLALKKLRTNNI